MSKVVACGIDIEELARFDKHAEGAEDALLRDICTEREIGNLRSDRRLHLALAFSCKEAMFKALGASWLNSGISFKEIELLFGGPGFTGYEIELSGCAQEILADQGCDKIDVSLEYNKEYVIVQIVLLAPGIGMNG
ncbi:holo-ACP synthase [Acidobacteriota bacterium]